MADEAKDRTVELLSEIYAELRVIKGILLINLAIVIAFALAAYSASRHA